jgi:hypothetical protein
MKAEFNNYENEYKSNDEEGSLSFEPHIDSFGIVFIKDDENEPIIKYNSIKIRRSLIFLNENIKTHLKKLISSDKISLLGICKTENFNIIPVYLPKKDDIIVIYYDINSDFCIYKSVNEN